MMSGGRSWLHWKEEGSELFKKGQWLEAMNCYTWAIRAKNDEAILYSNRAICELRLQKFQLAREDAESALRLDSKNVKFYRILSEALVELNLQSEALTACDEGLKWDPRDPILLIRQRNCQQHISKQTPAQNEPKADESDKQSGRKCKKLKTKEIKTDQPTPNLNDLMAEKLRQGSLSAKSYFEALKIFEVAKCLLEAQRCDEAFNMLRETSRGMWRLPYATLFVTAAKTILEKDPENHAALFILRAYGEDGDCLDNLKRSLRLVDLHPSNPDYQFLLSIALAGNFQLEKALEHCDRALEVLIVPFRLFFRANLLQMIGPPKFHIDDMIEAYRRYLSSVPTDHGYVAESYYAIGFLYSRSNDTAKAIALYSKGLEAEDPAVRLPCFADFQGFVPKMYLQAYFKENGLWPIKHSNVVEPMCSTCTTTQQLSSCSRCKAVWYCSRQCLKFNWMVHKKNCFNC